VRAALTLLALALPGCRKPPPLSWTAPASSGWPSQPCEAADPALEQRFEGGIEITGQQAAALFPDLGLQASWVARCSVTALEVQRCGQELVLVDPQLRFASRRGEWLDVAVITDALVHPRNILGLQRDALHSPPPTGAWLAPDRTTLRHVGPVVVGTAAISTAR
jgi:hypothetical protein